MLFIHCASKLYHFIVAINLQVNIQEEICIRSCYASPISPVRCVDVSQCKTRKSYAVFVLVTKLLFYFCRNDFAVFSSANYLLHSYSNAL